MKEIKLGSAEARRLFPGLDAPLGVIVTAIKARRTTDQNSALWPACRALGDHVGLRAEEVYDEAACTLFGYEVVVWRGEQRKVPLRRPSRSDRDDFSALIDLVHRWCVSEGVVWRQDDPIKAIA